VIELRVWSEDELWHAAGEVVQPKPGPRVHGARADLVVLRAITAYRHETDKSEVTGHRCGYVWRPRLKGGEADAGEVSELQTLATLLGAAGDWAARTAAQEGEGEAVTPEEEKAVDERVRGAFIAGQLVMKQKIVEMYQRQEKWDLGSPSRTVESVAPSQVLDEDATASLIERLTRGCEL